jgi:hypothetical protein
MSDRWLAFENFLADMGERPDGTSLERRDNDKGYTPENCYRATPHEQSRNKSNNRYITICGKKHLLKDACVEYGINWWTLHSRVRRHGETWTEQFYNLLETRL